MTYLEKNERFLGTGKANRAGQNLKDFLEAYNPKKYDNPCNTVDMLIFRSDEPYRYADQPLKLLMVRRSNHPSIGWWALPGGFVELRENLEDAARRELEEETGLKGLPLIQLGTWGDYDRDPRWRVITTAYLALVEEALPVKAGDDAADALWMDLSLERTERPAKETFRLKLSNEEHSVFLCADIKRTVQTNGLLKNSQYELLSCDGIASDHGLMITDAVLHLRELAAPPRQ